MAKVIQASVLRNHLSDTLNEVGRREDFLLIARNGELVSVLANIDFFEDLLAAHSKGYLKGMREARRQFRRGKVLTHEEVFGKL